MAGFTLRQNIVPNILLIKSIDPMAVSLFAPCFKIKLVRYGVVGLVSTGIHVLVASLFIRFINPSLLVSNLVGFFVAYHFSYYFQSKWVFKSNISLVKSLRYLVVQLSSLLVAVLFSHLLGDFSLYLKVVLTAFLLPLITFIIHRAWTFADQKESGVR
ncbi:conserved hypothetical protein [Desulforapulum autotrophicum HRM2]|uniref:GtrA/DPMS transmembrane domain-containing protein n=1 Tax=Desulforapulum autotrophicum (strain ATCC 43914 / DSM 3382 / VKM B-1955 / HRM2) TaxID=177437 RepID=C0QK47_DESAH|nr:conserved hypothetical protein [Desulforapulum autotrophicum HRM2]